MIGDLEPKVKESLSLYYQVTIDFQLHYFEVWIMLVMLILLGFYSKENNYIEIKC